MLGNAQAYAGNLFNTLVFKIFSLTAYSGEGPEQTNLIELEKHLKRKRRECRKYLNSAKASYIDSAEKNEGDRPLASFSKYSFLDYRKLDVEKYEYWLDIISKELKIVSTILELEEKKQYDVFTQHEIYQDIRKARQQQRRRS